MPKRVIISADSTCDLPLELIERHDIKIIPLSVLLGEESIIDDANFNPDRIYEYYEKTGTLPKTSAPGIQQFLDHFSPWVEEGCEIVHLDLSSELSSTFANARIAASELEGVYPVDTRNLSTGTALLVLEAAKCRDEGMSAADIAAHIEGLIPKVSTSFVIDNLEYLWKGGRCSGVAALGANMLKLRPAIEMRNGKLEVYKKYRGAMQNVYRQYLREKLTEEELYSNNVFLTYSGGVSGEALEELKGLIIGFMPTANVMIQRTGCTISAHCGPGTLGVLFIKK